MLKIRNVLMVAILTLLLAGISSAAEKLPHLIDLGADKCIPCKMMAPILDELGTEFAGQLKVTFIDVWKNRDQGAEYGVRMIPTQIFYDPDGKELYRHQGFFGKEEILTKWRELGYEFTHK
ncbi:thioredoxin family protein [Trichloromonas sp.]|uniref:thioredoxin family protein n=1 Tax=Trichloromonas sp. TaxID=3069249 RepID=UPI003D818586